MNPREEEEVAESGAERKERVNGGEERIGDRGKEERKVKLRREDC